MLPQGVNNWIFYLVLEEIVISSLMLSFLKLIRIT